MFIPTNSDGQNSVNRERDEERKIKKNNSHFSRNSLSVSLLYDFIFFFLNLKWDLYVPFLHFSVCFSSETIYFVTVSILFILIEYVLYICIFFWKFSKIPVSGFTLNPSPRIL